MDFDIILLKCSDVAQLNPLYVYNLVQVIKKTLFKLLAQPKALQILGGLYVVLVYFRQIATVTVVSQNAGHVRIFLVPFSILVDRRTCGQTLSLSLPQIRKADYHRQIVFKIDVVHKVVVPFFRKDFKYNTRYYAGTSKSQVC